jgi:hypothetical protein
MGVRFVAVRHRARGAALRRDTVIARPRAIAPVRANAGGRLLEPADVPPTSMVAGAPPMSMDAGAPPTNMDAGAHPRRADTTVATTIEPCRIAARTVWQGGMTMTTTAMTGAGCPEVTASDQGRGHRMLVTGRTMFTGVRPGRGTVWAVKAGALTTGAVSARATKNGAATPVGAGDDSVVTAGVQALAAASGSAKFPSLDVLRPAMCSRTAPPRPCGRLRVRVRGGGKERTARLRCGRWTDGAFLCRVKRLGG